MKRVLFLCDYRSPYSGNFIKSICHLSEALHAQGTECYFLFPLQAKERQWMERFSENVVFFEDFNEGYTYFLKNVIAIIKNHSIDVLHTHFFSPNKVKPISYLCRNVKIFVHLHSDFTGGKQSVAQKVKQTITYHTFTSQMTFLCVSEVFAKYNKKNSIWSPNAVVCDTALRNDSDRQMFRNNRGICQSDMLIEIFAWSPYVKGVDVAVEAVKAANDSGYPFKLMIVCGVKYNEATMREYIASHTSCTGDENYLIYVPPTEDVFAYHHFADVLLSTSRSEGFSYSLIEMLSLGKRCVISDIPGTSWAEAYSLVTVFQSESTLGCRDALIKISNSRPYDADVESAVKECYSIHRWVDTIISTYGLNNTFGKSDLE